MRKHIISAFLICSLLLVSGCLFEEVAGGGTETNTEVTVSGVVLDDHGIPTEGAVVAIVPSNFNPTDFDSSQYVADTTPANGKFEIKFKKVKSYNLIAYFKRKNLSFMATNIGDTGSLSESYHYPNVELKKSSTFSIHINELSLKSRGVIYFPGTLIYKTISIADSIAGILQLTNIPASTYDSLIYTTTNGSNVVNLLETKLQVTPNSNLSQGPFASWHKHWNIYINTSNSGIPITEDIVQFPLLVRLDSSFSFLNSNGSDLRVTKSNGTTPLPFYIEKWDPKSKSALVWVSMDTIYYNNANQFIKIYIGKDSVKNISVSNDVFGISNNFKAVWKLNDNTKTTFVEEILGRFTGRLMNDPTQDHTRVGVIGNSLFFNNTNRISFAEDANLVSDEASVSVSSWINPRVSKLRTILDISQGDGIASKNSLLRLEIDGNEIIHLYAVSGENDVLQEIKVATPIESNKWSHVVGVVDYAKDSMYIYINGEEKAALGANFLNSKTLAFPSNHFAIGSSYSEGANYFDGYIDEIQISRVKQSSSWIKYSYETQKVGSTVLKMEVIK